MEFPDTLKHLMDSQNLKQADLCRMTGIPTSLMSNYMKGLKFPSLTNSIALSKALNVSIDALAGVDKKKKSPSELSEEALKVAKDYHGLDRHGKTMTRLVMAEERKRMEEEEARRREKELFLTGGDELGEPADARVIPLYFTPAAAGYASPAFGEDFDYLEIGGEVPRAADFAVRIDGDSMAPYIMDGSIAYVNRDPLADGDVGIFSLDGDMLCKQYHRDEEGGVHLYSLNRERADADRHIPPDGGSTLACFGRVILPHRVNLPVV